MTVIPKVTMTTTIAMTTKRDNNGNKEKAESRSIPYTEWTWVIDGLKQDIGCMVFSMFK